MLITSATAPFSRLQRHTAGLSWPCFRGSRNGQPAALQPGLNLRLCSPKEPILPSPQHLPRPVYARDGIQSDYCGSPAQLLHQLHSGRFDILCIYPVPGRVRPCHFRDGEPPTYG